MLAIKQIIIPLSLFIFIALVASIMIVLLYQYFNRRLTLQAIQQIIDKNQNITPEQIRAILIEQSSSSDLRKGIICLCISIATVIFGLIMNNEDLYMVQKSLFGMALFPLLVAVAYLGFHYFNQNDDTAT